MSSRGASFLAGDESEWYASLRSLILDRDLRRATIAAAQAHLIENYSRASLTRQLFRILAEVGSQSERSTKVGS